MTEDSIFGDLESRATAPDRLILRDYVLRGEIGAFAIEYGQEQGLRFNIVAELAGAPTSGDDVDSILSYDSLTQAITDQLANERLQLLETLAERICAQILTHAQVARTFIRIEKLDRIDGALGVEIARSRGDISAQTPPPASHKWDAPIVFLGNDILESDDASQWLNALINSNAVICLDTLAGFIPSKTTPARVLLLSIEQNTWALANRESRLSVLSSKTELDSALREQKPALLAPTKIWTDSAPDLPAPLTPIAIARWFAAQFFTSPLKIATLAAIKPQAGEAVIRRPDAL